MTGRRLDNTLSLDIPEGPCVQFQCPSARRCKAEKLACAAFRHFVATGRVLSPDHEYDKYGRKLILNRNRIPGPRPTRSMYDQVFPGTDAEDGR